MNTDGGHGSFESVKELAMPGLLPVYRPKFSPKELAQAREVSRKRTAPHSMVQRAKLVLLLVESPP